MLDYQIEFIELALKHKVLKFGSFTLKSGRESPYFFNAGEFCTSAALAKLGECYASAIVAGNLSFDLLFGPAYKGIPLVASCAVSLSRDHGIDLPYAFDRKEAKAHGEGGMFVGAPMQGRVLVLDDVITAGTAIRKATGMITDAGATVAGVLIGLDRREKGQSGKSAVEELGQLLGVEVQSLICLDHIIAYIEESASDSGTLERLQNYRATYGVQ